MNGYATLGDVYGPTAGPSFDAANVVGADNAPTTAQQMSDSGGAHLQPVQLFKGLAGINPLVGGVVILLVLFGVKMLREWKATEGDVKDIKAGLYSTVVVTLMAAAGLPILKAILAKYQIPGVSAYVQNA
jgi:hypothetical protein